jgi:hypothetical protein
VVTKTLLTQLPKSPQKKLKKMFVEWYPRKITPMFPYPNWRIAKMYFKAETSPAIFDRQMEMMTCVPKHLNLRVGGYPQYFCKGCMCGFPLLQLVKMAKDRTRSLFDQWNQNNPMSMFMY